MNKLVREMVNVAAGLNHAALAACDDRDPNAVYFFYKESLAMERKARRVAERMKTLNSIN